MRLFWIIIIGMLLIAPGAAAQDPAAMDPEEKVFWVELEKVKDPFESPIKKPKVAEPVKPPVPVVAKPVEPVKLVPPPPKPQPSPTPTPPRLSLPAPVLPQVDEKAAMALLLNGVKINGIIWSADMPQAIINDRVLKVGDEVQGAKILSIKKDGVEVSHKGMKYILTIPVDIK
jgi:hypothetical protein